MPVTEHYSTVKLAFLNEKILQKNSVCYCANGQNLASKEGTTHYKVKSLRQKQELLTKTLYFLPFRKLNYFARFSYIKRLFLL